MTVPSLSTESLATIGSSRSGKHPQWRQRFADFIHDLQVRNNNGQLKFGWNPHAEDSYNCLTFSSKVVELQTGRDLYGNMAELEYYTTPLEAYRTLKKLGFDSLDQLIGSLFKMRTSPVYAQTGDLLLIPAKPILDDEVELGSMDWAVAVADPPNFWTISADYGLARGRILAVAMVAKAYEVI